MVARFLLAATLGVAGVAAAQSQGQGREEELRWRVSLSEKAQIHQQNALEKHLIEGTFGTRAPVHLDGRPVDRALTGNPNLGHTSSWTGSYLVGLAFRLGWAKEHGTPQDVEAALNLGGMSVNGIYMLTHISGKPGFLSRGAARGHGLSYEERGGSGTRDKWWQGVGPYSEFRFKGGPSHHNYDQVTRGLGLWYYFLQKDNPNPTGRFKAQMDSVRAIYQDIINYAYKSHDLVVYDFDSTISATLLFGREGRPGTTSLMVTNALTFGYWITGDAWCRQRLQQVVREYNYLRPGIADSVRADADDTEHVMPGLWLASQVEQDPQLKRFYQQCQASLFESFKKERRSLFNYLYAATTGDRAGADLPGALRTMQEYPTGTLFYPIMNSIRTDVEFIYEGREQRQVFKDVPPFYDIVTDNEYEWKGGGRRQQLDGWLARPVSSFAVSQEDPMVWLLSDGKLVYQSLDGGRTFTVNEYPPMAEVRDITFAGKKNRIAALATSDGLYLTFNGGYNNIDNQDYQPSVTWKRQQVGSADNNARQVIVDRRNANVLWAVMGDGVYRSVDLGRNDIGRLWRRVSPAFPAEWSADYTVVTGARPRIYALTQGRFYRAAPGDADWTAAEMNGLSSYVSVGQIAPMPDKPDTLLVLAGSRRGNISLVLKSLDGGRTVQGMPQSTRELLAFMQRRPQDRVEYTSIVIDPNNPQNVYAASPKGFYRSTDGGTTWQQSNTGLRIPYLYHVHAAAEMPGKIVASTPAGLHVSTDGGQTWSREVLVLNGPGVDRIDLGGMAYIVAYWPGRYFGYITDEQAAASPSAWGW